MARIVMRVLDGADRGRVFDDLETPVTVGREEGNSVQLNDERVSRYHVKIQEDNEKLVLTDLESTNGTKVNGEDIQLRILRFGDMIMMGRSVLLFGSPEQIAGRLAGIRKNSADSDGGGSVSEVSDSKAAALDFELNYGDDPDTSLQVIEPPDLPERLSPAQAAQMSEMLEYLHLRIRTLLNSVKVDGKRDRVSLELRQWQGLLEMQSQLAGYLRQIGEPD